MNRLIATLLILSAALQAQNARTLFRDLPPERRGRPATGVSAASTDSTAGTPVSAAESAARATGMPVKRARLAGIDLSLVDLRAADALNLAINRPQPLQTITLNLFADATVNAVMKRATRPEASETLVWSGDVVGGTAGTVTIANTRGVVSGRVELNDGRRFEIRPVQGRTGVQNIIELDTARLPQERQPLPARQPGGAADILALPDVLDDGSVIDVLVAWTHGARNAAGGDAAVRNMIAIAERDANDGLSASGIQFRVRIVATAEVSFDESVGFDATLSKLAGTADGAMDELHALRDRFGADAVSLWINRNDFCGLAYLMRPESGAFAASAFSTVSVNCAVSNFSFMHELGHNLGAQHDRDSADSPGYFRYSYGFRQLAATPPFRTIMAYPCAGTPCPRINRWSNPNTLIGGFPGGVALGQFGECDNASTLNQTRTIAARWRNSVSAPLVSGATRTTPQPSGNMSRRR